MFMRNVAGAAKFSPEKMGKATVVHGDTLFAGLNCFEPGQEHAAHTHAGQDKLYYLLSGSGEILIGDRTENLSAGDAAFAPAGVPHAIRNSSSERLVVMAILAPPPPRTS
jgi:quercetin dioxygenase-like cupin family protein